MPSILLIRKVIKKRKLFPTDDSAKKVVYLAIRDASKKWTMPIRNWKVALNRFMIEFEDRLAVSLWMSHPCLPCATNVVWQFYSPAISQASYKVIPALTKPQFGLQPPVLGDDPVKPGQVIPFIRRLLVN
jgi:hypothetical protein